MKKNKSRVVSVILALLLMTVLAACSGNTITAGPKGATFDFTGLTEDDVEETTAQFHFDDGILTVKLESGTANVEICSIIPMVDEDDIYDEVDVLYEGEGLKDGDQIEVNGVGGDVVMRVWGKAGKGTVKIAPKE